MGDRGREDRGREDRRRRRTWAAAVHVEDACRAVVAGGDDPAAVASLRQALLPRRPRAAEDARAAAAEDARDAATLPAAAGPESGTVHEGAADVFESAIRPELLHVAQKISMHFQLRRNEGNVHDLNDHLAMWIVETGVFDEVRSKLLAALPGQAEDLSAGTIFQLLFLFVKLQAQGAPDSVFFETQLRLNDPVRSGRWDMSEDQFRRLLRVLLASDNLSAQNGIAALQEPSGLYQAAAGARVPYFAAGDDAADIQALPERFSRFACDICLSPSSAVTLETSRTGPVTFDGFDRCIAARSVATGVVFAQEFFDVSATLPSHLLQVLAPISVHPVVNEAQHGGPQVYVDTAMSPLLSTRGDMLRKLNLVNVTRLSSRETSACHWKVRWGRLAGSIQEDFEVSYVNGLGTGIIIRHADARFAPDQWTGVQAGAAEDSIDKGPSAPAGSTSPPPWNLPEASFVQICAAGPPGADAFPMAFGRTTNTTLAVMLAALAFRWALAENAEMGMPDAVREACASVFAATGDMHQFVNDVQEEELLNDAALNAVPLAELQQLAFGLGLPVSPSLGVAELVAVIRPVIAGNLMQAGVAASLLRPIRHSSAQDSLARSCATAALRHELVRLKFATRVLAPRRFGLVHAVGVPSHSTALEGVVAYEPAFEMTAEAPSAMPALSPAPRIVTHAAHLPSLGEAAAAAAAAVVAASSLAQQPVESPPLAPSSPNNSSSDEPSPPPPPPGLDLSAGAAARAPDDAEDEDDKALDTSSFRFAAVEAVLRRSTAAVAEEKVALDRFGEFTSVTLDPEAATFDLDTKTFFEMVPRRADRCSILQRTASGIPEVIFVVVAPVAVVADNADFMNAHGSELAEGRILRIVHVRCGTKLVTNLALVVSHLSQVHLKWTLDAQAPLPRDEDLDFLKAAWDVGAAEIKLRRWQAIQTAVLWASGADASSTAVEGASGPPRLVHSIVPRIVNWCDEYASLRECVFADGLGHPVQEASAKSRLLRFVMTCANNAVNSFLAVGAAASLQNWRDAEAWAEHRKANGSLGFLVAAKVSWPGFCDAMRRYVLLTNPPLAHLQQMQLNAAPAAQGGAAARARGSSGSFTNAVSLFPSGVLRQQTDQDAVRYQGEVWDPSSNNAQMDALRESTESLIGRSHAVRMRLLAEDSLLVFLRQTHNRGMRHTASTIEMHKFGDDIDKSVRRDGIPCYLCCAECEKKIKPGHTARRAYHTKTWCVDCGLIPLCTTGRAMWNNRTCFEVWHDPAVDIKRKGNLDLCPCRDPENKYGDPFDDQGETPESDTARLFPREIITDTATFLRRSSRKRRRVSASDAAS